jgi:3-hydroxy-3-methylglutaryl CoA synthase
MIQFKLIRSHPKDKYTIGDFYIDYGDGLGYQFFSNTLEDTVRDINKDGVNEVKIYGETAIPYGTYKVTITYSPKFQRNLPLVNNVNGFEGVRIHPGNTPQDTEGCILVGVNDQIGQIHQSKVTFDKLFQIMTDSNQKEFTLEIV